MLIFHYTSLTHSTDSDYVKKKLCGLKNPTLLYIVKHNVCFPVDASSAGSGKLTAEVRGHSTAPSCEVTSHASDYYVVSFVPHEVVPHYVNLMFNGDKVPGLFSQFHSKFKLKIQRVEIQTAHVITEMNFFQLPVN